MYFNLLISILFYHIIDSKIEYEINIIYLYIIKILLT